MADSIYIKAPIVGDGKSRATAFRADLPAVPGIAFAALIPTDESGKPLYADAIVEVRQGAVDVVAALESERVRTGRSRHTLLTQQDAHLEALRRTGPRFPTIT